MCRLTPLLQVPASRWRTTSECDANRLGQPRIKQGIALWTTARSGELTSKLHRNEHHMLTVLGGWNTDNGVVDG